MTRFALVAAVAALAAGLTPAPTAGTPSASRLIRPGVAIGPVRLGMTFAQVRRALGRPQLVNRRQDRGFGNRYVEYLWGYGDWRVGLLGRPGRERVVRVATGLRRERTREGVGVGTTAPQLARRYRREAECISRNYNVPDAGTWIVLRGPGSRMTAFWLFNGERVANPTRPSFVAEVMIQHAWITPIAGRCTWDWTRD